MIAVFCNTFQNYKEFLYNFPHSYHKRFKWITRDEDLQDDKTCINFDGVIKKNYLKDYDVIHAYLTLHKNQPEIFKHKL